ncbi:hypothetical protein QR680_001214 [Steinernema hermaphroditum]|uniref:Uncharacterized protein n=1 Tax=Steinernema hermaphroditum TaxID=289476 RepID=A0AA39GXG5_9BILA|nr:hypothetical protein QR680_001214 [Steinernema hermaphroditum]
MPRGGDYPCRPALYTQPEGTARSTGASNCSDRHGVGRSTMNNTNFLYNRSGSESPPPKKTSYEPPILNHFSSGPGSANNGCSGSGKQIPHEEHVLRLDNHCNQLGYTGLPRMSELMSTTNVDNQQSDRMQNN